MTRSASVFVLVFVCCASTACSDSLPEIAVQALPALPRPVANNAVAALASPQGVSLFSFLGLGPGKTWRDTDSVAMQLDPGARVWRIIAPVPGADGRLAGTAQGVGERVYVFGGYTVAEDGSERSVESVYALDPASGRYEPRAPMPVPVDDTVSLVYQQRYIYLVSGWHDRGNVNLVQLYDTHTDRWRQATPYPGPPVFGHAGGMVARVMVICDGVQVIVEAHGPRRYEATDACYIGEVDAEEPADISWHRLPAHPGPARYRMASVGSVSGGARIVFAGGSDNPYNYSGIGYDGAPSAPADTVFSFALEDKLWRTHGRLAVATMDHRGLIALGDEFVIVGGMRAGQQVSDTVLRFALPD